jgi:hypothetical protein
MENLILAGISLLVMLVFNFTKEKETFRISWDKLAQFCGFLAILTVFRIYQYIFMLDMGLMKRLPMIPAEISGHMWTLGLVFWEDMFFAVPLYFIWKYMSRKWLQISLTVILSVLFGLGHAYQGWQGVAITMFLPYFVSYHFGKKYGFGTSMCGHVLYDFATVMAVQMLPIVMGFGML